MSSQGTPAEYLPSSQRLQSIRDGMFFIVGPHRAGTTLLQAMLSSHSAITIPPETGFFDQVWPRRHTFGPLTDDRQLELIGRRLNEAGFSISDLQVEWTAVAETLRTTARGYDDLFTVLMSLYADSCGRRRAGEKSPRHLFAAIEIAERFPQAKFLCLIRDPRAVAHSERQTAWGSRSVCRIARRWCRVVDELSRLRSVWDEHRLRVIYYEQLVANPEPVLRQICEFLGEAFEPQMLQFHERPAWQRGFRPDEVWKENTLRAVDAQRVQHWRTALSPAQVQLIEHAAGPRLLQHGYDPAVSMVSRRALLAARVSDYLQWMWEIVRGLWRGRGRRRPWSSVWKDVWKR